MKPRLIVHIGTPKTGTTTLQYSLFDARGAMRANHGVYYAGTDRRASQPRKHLSVSSAAKSEDPGKRDTEYLALLDDFERSGAHTLIVSEETMGYPNEAVPAFFQRFNEKFDVEVVCYLRRQDVYMESLYNQAMRMRRYFGLPHLPYFWRDDRFFNNMDYHRMLTLWKDAGAEVVAVNFQTEVKSQGLVPSFLQAARLDVGEVEERTVNESVDMRLLLALRMISAKKAGGGHAAMMKGMTMAAATLQDKGLFKPMKSTLGSRERKLIIETCRESNELLERDFGIRFDDSMPKEQPHTILRPEPSYVLSLLGELSLTHGVEFLRQCRRRKRAGLNTTEAEENVAEVEVNLSAPDASDPQAVEALAQEFGLPLSGAANHDVTLQNAQTPRLLELLAQLSTSDGMRLLERCRARLLSDLERLEAESPDEDAPAPAKKKVSGKVVPTTMHKPAVPTEA